MSAFGTLSNLPLLTNTLNFRCFELEALENLGVQPISCNKFVLIPRTGKLLKKKERFGVFPNHSCLSPDIIKSYLIVLYFVTMNVDLEGHAMACLTNGISLNKGCI